MNTSLFRTKTAILTGVLLLALSLPLQAAHKGKHAGKHAGKKHAAITQTFTVAAGAKISVAGNKHATLADIKVGDRVKIAYTQANGTLTAAHIKDLGPKSAKHTKHAKHAKKAKSTTKKHHKHHKHHKHASTSLHAKGIVQSFDTSNQTLMVTEKHRR